MGCEPVAEFENTQYAFALKTYVTGFGKDISELSGIIAEEKEILYPPNTEFKYEFIGAGRDGYQVFKAEQKRTLQCERDYKYTSDFEKKPIVLEKIVIKLRLVNNFLVKVKKKNISTKISSFLNTVDNSKKIKCLTDVIDSLHNLFEKYK